MNLQVSINIKALTLLLMYSMHSSSLVNIGTNVSFVTDKVGVLSFYKQEKIQYALNLKPEETSFAFNIYFPLPRFSVALLL